MRRKGSWLQEDIYCEKYGIPYQSDLRDWYWKGKATPVEKYRNACEPDDIRTISQFPNQVIDFIKRCNFWETQLDEEFDARRRELG